MRATTVLFASLLLAACSNDLDFKTRCDLVKATTPVYTDSGYPYFPGQALIVGSCGPCHETIIDTHAPNAFAPRNGAPIDLNWDLDYRAIPSAQLHAGLLETYSMRDDIWGQVSGGHMPPTHTMGSTADPAATVTTLGFHNAAGPLPTLRTPEGREILRNWLACKTPIVQGTPDMPGDLAMPFGNVEPCEFGACNFCRTAADCAHDYDCDTTTNQCVLPPHWGNIYRGVVQVHCALSGCHGDVGHSSGMTLSATDSHMAYMALVGVASDTNPSCMGMGFTRVSAGHSDMSLLIDKLNGNGTPTGAVCGMRMPLGGPYLLPYEIAGIAQWIDSGAPESP